jgi:hypothetical protein
VFYLFKKKLFPIVLIHVAIFVKKNLIKKIFFA